MVEDEHSVVLYKMLKKHRPIARFGLFKTPYGDYEMPSITPSIVKDKDAKALYKNIQKGLDVKVISPKASCRRALLPIKDIMFPDEKKEVRMRKPLIVADPESEALSLPSSLARIRFLKEGVPSSIKPLFSCGLTADAEKGRKEVYSAWKEVAEKTDFAMIKDWAVGTQQSVNSDIFLAPTPIILSNSNATDKAFEYGYTILDDARAEPVFTMSGLHLLLHSEIFSDGVESEITRKKIIEEIDSWSGRKGKYKGSVLSLKLYGQIAKFGDSSSGAERRATFSDFLQQLSEKVRNADGVLICHDFGNWGMGILDSGADISTFRISGMMRKIDSLMRRKGGKTGPLPTPPIFDIGTLVDIGVNNVKKEFSEKGAFPVPSCMNPKPYWAFGKWSEKKIYSNRTRCGALIELGLEYRDAGMNEGANQDIPLSEALKDRIQNSRIRQELMDLCPSLTASHIRELGEDVEGGEKKPGE